MLPTSKTLVYVIVYMCFFFVCCEKGVKKQDVEEKINSTGIKEYSEMQIWKETVSYDCAS